jgi:hypothetical protein
LKLKRTARQWWECGRMRRHKNQCVIRFFRRWRLLSPTSRVLLFLSLGEKQIKRRILVLAQLSLLLIMLLCTKSPLVFWLMLFNQIGCRQWNKKPDGDIQKKNIFCLVLQGPMGSFWAQYMSCVVEVLIKLSVKTFLGKCHVQQRV